MRCDAMRYVLVADGRRSAYGEAGRKLEGRLKWLRRGLAKGTLCFEK